VPPPLVGSDENGAAPKPATTVDVDYELTLTKAVVPGLVGAALRPALAHAGFLEFS
jgi:hypothetical protein